MKPAAWRLLVAAAIFLVWVGWLIYEVVTTADPIVISRPQILIAPIIVEAEAKGDDKIAITRIYRGAKAPGIAVGQEVVVKKLDQARNWEGTGRSYVLALQSAEPGQFQLVPVPVSSGFQPPPGSEYDKPPVYPIRSGNRSQLEAQLEEALKLRSDREP
jgi:hypothetical protein